MVIESQFEACRRSSNQVLSSSSLFTAIGGESVADKDAIHHMLRDKVVQPYLAIAATPDLTAI